MRARYHWENWSDGLVHVLKKDVDFTDITAFRGAAHSQGLRRGGRYSIRQQIRGYDDTILVQFVKTVERQPPPPPKLQIDLELLNKALKLVHPDLHSGKWNDDAHEVFKALMDLRDEMIKKKKKQ